MTVHDDDLWLILKLQNSLFYLLQKSIQNVKLLKWPLRSNDIVAHVHDSFSTVRRCISESQLSEIAYYPAMEIEI